MDRLLRRWEEQLRRYHPKLKLFQEGRGSATAMPSLTKGISDFGPMSREVTDDEMTLFQSKFGYPPLQLRVALDALAVYVHPDNPIAKRGLNLAELDAIFSSTDKRGHADISVWGQLGLTGKWENAPIHVYCRNPASGTYVYFREHVLNGGDFKTTDRQMVGSEAVLQAVAADPLGIGFSGIGYKTTEVATVPLSADSAAPVPPEPQFAYGGQYPLARYLYLTINHKPDEVLTPLQFEVLNYVYSRDGQEQVTEEGFFPVTAKIAVEERKKAGIGQ
jgi:phosphate transport system substrate-binding protein